MKYLYLIILIGAFYVSNSQNQVTLKTDFPSAVKPGSDYIVNVTINKADLNDFAVYTQTFPDGYIITENRTGEGIFKFEDQKLTVTWFRLPEREKINFSYNVEFNKNLKGNFPLKGRFTYLHNNVKGNIYTNTINVNVSDNNPSISNVANYNKNGKQNENVTNNKSNKANTNSNKGINCVRKMTFDKVKKGYIVELNIKTGAINTIARITETVPEGCNVEKLEAKGTEFRFRKNKVSIIWDKIPQNSNITVKYILLCKPDKKPNIEGTIAYIKNSKLQSDIIK